MSAMAFSYGRDSRITANGVIGCRPDPAGGRHGGRPGWATNRRMIERMMHAARVNAAVATLAARVRGRGLAG